MIIGLIGRKGSGKDTVAEMIQAYIYSNQHIRFEMHKIASPVKEITSILTGYSIDQLEDVNLKDSLIPGKNYTPRDVMKLVGTEIGRKLDEDIWVDLFFKNYTPESNWIITDTRFPNEITAIRERGGIIIKVKRDFDFITREDAIQELGEVYALYPDDTESLIENRTQFDNLPDGVLYGVERELDNSISESALDDYTGYDYLIKNNYTIESLLLKVKSILSQENLITYENR